MDDAPRGLATWVVRAVGSARVRAGLAAYLVAIVFGLGYFLTRAVAGAEPQWVAVAIGIAAAAPLVVGFVGYRISSFRISGLEVSLSAATVSTSADIPTDELNALDASDISQLTRQLRQLIAAPGSQLLELDLRNGDYWWPTRLFLLSALLRDHTDVRRLVFVHGARREYVGMAEPAAVCRRVGETTPGLSAAYTAAREAAAIEMRPLAGVRPDDSRIVEMTVQHWPGAVRQYVGRFEGEDPQRVGSSWLAQALGEDLHRAALNVDNGPASVLTQYRILVMEQDFVALITDGQLSRVVGRCRLASAVATSFLEQQLAGPTA